MSLHELNENQREQLKQRVLFDRLGAQDEFPSWSELAAVNEPVTDNELEAEFGGVEFHADDFFC